ncbi:MAG: hypothetical protein NTZ74_00980 [Chloroflexi bacterium]|nr:hypothetical protein [Chloroflexota bacterium]
MHSLVTQIHPLVQIRRDRKLPVIGSVLVRVGQKVTPTQLLAESRVSSQHLLVDVYRALGLKNASEAEKLIHRRVGDPVDKQDILAETGGMFSRVIRAPLPGKIVSIKSGQILLETGSRQITVQSGFSGSVVEVIKDRGAVVETNGMLVQGVWGNDKIGFGPFLVEAETIGNELTLSSLSITARGAVVAAAYCTEEEGLRAAENVQVGGLILGSMNPQLISIAMDLHFPVVLLEGFHQVGINEFTRNLLLSNAKREISINAAKWDRFTGDRPEIVIALPAAGDSYRREVELAPGQVVRVHTAPYCGRVGSVQNIISGLSTLPNGLRTTAAAVKFQNNENVIIPISNLDIIDLDDRFLGKTE